MISTDHIKALINTLEEITEGSGFSDKWMIEKLLEIFDPEELVELGYGDRVKAYIDEYGAEGEWMEICEKARKRGIQMAFHAQAS